MNTLGKLKSFHLGGEFRDLSLCPANCNPVGTWNNAIVGACGRPPVKSLYLSWHGLRELERRDLNRSAWGAPDSDSELRELEGGDWCATTLAEYF